MAFKQPRVPEFNEKDGVSRYLKTLVLFLKDFCQEAWVANRQSAKSVPEIDYPVTSVNSKTGDVELSAADVGARPASWMPNASEVGALQVNGTAVDSNKLGGKTPGYYDRNATKDQAGMVKIGEGLDVSGDGTLSVTLNVSSIQGGAVSCSVGANGSANVSIIYPKSMNRAPTSIHTQVLTSTPNLRFASNNNGTADGFTIYFINNTSSNATVWAYWTAIWLGGS